MQLRSLLPLGFAALDEFAMVAHATDTKRED